jgi:hypothetical protein
MGGGAGKGAGGLGGVEEIAGGGVMTTVSQKKSRVDWRMDGPACCNCINFRSDIRSIETICGTTWKRETNKRCVVLNCAVARRNWCSRHEFPMGTENDLLR